LEELPTRARSLLRAAVIAAVVSLPFGSVQATSQSPSGGTAAEYVVTYAPAARAEALAAIKRAGGTVTGTVDALGVTRVDTTDAQFQDKVSASAVVRGVARNHSVGTVRPGMPHRFVIERPIAAEAGPAPAGVPTSRGPRHGVEPLSNLQWDMAMIGATPSGAWKTTTGRGVQVGIIDTGVDASHPDLAPVSTPPASTPRTSTTAVTVVTSQGRLPPLETAWVSLGLHPTPRS
jgi:subtilisin family serine protease